MTISDYKLEKLQLFPTEVQILRWKTRPGFNKRLASVCKDFYLKEIAHRMPYMGYNLWDLDVPELIELRGMYVSAMSSALESYFKPQVKLEQNFMMQAWLRIDEPNRVIPPHHHMGVGLVGTYYCKVDIAARRESVKKPSANPFTEGDLVVLDPRPAVRPRLSKYPDVENISPEEGMMVLMPDYLMHWVNPVAEGDERICIASNLFFNRSNFGTPVDIK